MVEFSEISYRFGFKEGVSNAVYLIEHCKTLTEILREERKFLDLIYKAKWFQSKVKYTHKVDRVLWKYREGLKHGFYTVYEGAAYNDSFNIQDFIDSVDLWVLEKQDRIVFPPNIARGNPSGLLRNGKVICHLYGTHKEVSK